METAPQREPLQRVASAPQFLRTAKALLLRRRTKEAINLLRRGLNLDPTCDEAALLLAKTLVAAKRLREARELLDRLLSREESADAYVLLLRVLIAEEDLGAARETAQRALVHAPKDKRLIELQARLEESSADSDLATLFNREMVGSAPGLEPEERPTVQATEEALVAQAGEKLAAEPGPGQLEVLLPVDDPQLGGAVPEELPTFKVTPEEVIPAGSSGSEPELDADTGGSTITPTIPGAPSLTLLARSSDAGPKIPPPRFVRLEPEDAVTGSLPSDELDFDRRPSAPDLISAVKQLVEPALDEITPRRPLFEGLLREAEQPASPAQRRASQATRRERPPVEDEDTAGLGGPTPPASPAAKHRAASRAAHSHFSPVLQLIDGTGKVHRIDDSRVVRPVGGVLVALDSPNPEPTMPAAAGPRVLLGGLPGGSLVGTRPRLLALQSAMRPALQPARSIFYRWWPLVLALALSAVAAGTVAGLMVRRSAQAREHVRQARELAADGRLGSLQRALVDLRTAANLSGRKPEILALAAAIHGRLAIEHGESDLRGAESLLEEAARLDADRSGSTEDMALARGFLQLGRSPLPDAIAFLFNALEQQPESLPLLLLYGEALARNGEHYLAGRVLEKLPSSNGQVLRARAYLLFRQGHLTEAEAMMRTAIFYGLPALESELWQAQIRVSAPGSDPRALARLQRLARDRRLSTRQRSWAHLLSAAVQLRLGQRHQARSSVSRALVSRPLGDLEFCRVAGSLLLELHDLDGAHREASEGHQLAPRDLRLIDLLARVEVGMDRPQDAVNRLLAVEELDAAGRLTLAEGYLRNGQLEPARSQLGRVSGEASPRFRLLSARLQLAAGKPYLALRELGRRDGESCAEAYHLRALAALAMADPAEATRWLRATVARDPLRAESLLELGRLARRQADGRAARSYLDQAVVANPHLRAARLELGQLLVELGDFAAAQAQFEEALALEPSSLPGLLGRARAGVELRGDDAAAFLRALTLRGEGLAAEVLAARLLMVRGDWRRAVEELARLLPRATENRELPVWLAQSYLELGNLTAAEAGFERALERGDSPEAHLGLSQIDLRRGRLGTALLHATTALEKLSRRVHPVALKIAIKLQLARCHRQAEGVGAAIAELQDVLELDRQSFAANLELGRIYTGLGKRSRAVQHLAAAVRVDPRSKEARSELARLCQGKPLEACSALSR